MEPQDVSEHRMNSEGIVSYTIAARQIGANFEVTEEELSARTQRSLSDDIYKQMWALLYQQHLGKLSFLELLDKYEEILEISPHT